MIRSWCGVALWKRQGKLETQDQLTLSDGGKVTRGNRMTAYFHLEANSSGKQIRIAEGIVGREVAESFRDNLIRMLRLD